MTIPEGDGEGITIEGNATKAARLTVPPGASGRTIPVLLGVTDDGDPALTRYGRVLLRVAGDEGSNPR